MSPLRPPKQCRRGHRYTGRFCDQCPAGWTERKPKSWRGGSTQEWRDFRAVWLAEHPVCMDFGTNPGCLGVATVVCHKPGTDYERDRCNPAAIEGQRCKSCDAKVTGRQGGRARWGRQP